MTTPYRFQPFRYVKFRDEMVRVGDGEPPELFRQDIRSEKTLERHTSTLWQIVCGFFEGSVSQLVRYGRVNQAGHSQDVHACAQHAGPRSGAGKLGGRSGVLDALNWRSYSRVHPEEVQESLRMTH